MYQFKYCANFILSFLILYVYSDIKFNSLSEKLVLSLIKATPKKNVVASEHLLRMTLCKLASIATADTKQELMTLLGYRDDIDLKTCYSKVAECIKILMQGDLTVTNRLYVSYTSDIDPKFINESSRNDGLQVEKVGFNYPKAAIAHINNLLSAMTYKRITDIVDSDDINKTTKMIAISGAHFKGSWESPFDYRLTKLTKFYHIDGKTSRIPMMNALGEYRYTKGNNCEVLSIRFGSYATSITFVVPRQANNLGSMLETIYNQKNFVNNLIKAAEEKLMKITIPKFKIKTFVDWTGFLQELGLVSVFNTNTKDMVGMFKPNRQNQTISLSKAKQKVFFQIDEMGVARKIPESVTKEFSDEVQMKECSFSTNRKPKSIVLATGNSSLRNLTINNADPRVTEKTPELSYYHDVPIFVADKPFYFEVAWDVHSGRYVLFAGVYYGPEPDLPSF